MQLFRLQLLFLDGLHELTNILLLDRQVHLIVLLVLLDVRLFHLLVLDHQLLLEFPEALIVSQLEGLNMLVVVPQLNFLSNYREIGASFDATLTGSLLWVLILLLHAFPISSRGFH